MPKLILGAANFTQPYGIKCKTQVARDEFVKILETALDAGIDMIDTSTAYVDNSSEAIKIIKKIKCFSDYWHYRDCIELAHGFDKINEFVDGASVDTPEEALKAIKMDMKFIQLPYNVFDHNHHKFFVKAGKKKIKIIARSIFLQGLLLMDNPPIGHEYIGQFDNMIKPYGISRKESAFLFAYGNPYIDYMVVGVDTADQLKELIKLTKYELPFSLINKILDLDVPEEIKYPWLWRL